MSSDHNEFRDVDSQTGILSNLLEVLFEKGVITENELKQILNRSDFVIEEED